MSVKTGFIDVNTRASDIYTYFWSVILQRNRNNSYKKQQIKKQKNG